MAYPVAGDLEHMVSRQDTSTFPPPQRSSAWIIGGLKSEEDLLNDIFVASLVGITGAIGFVLFSYFALNSSATKHFMRSHGGVGFSVAYTTSILAYMTAALLTGLLAFGITSGIVWCIVVVSTMVVIITVLEMKRQSQFARVSWLLDPVHTLLAGLVLHKIVTFVGIAAHQVFILSPLMNSILLLCSPVVLGIVAKIVSNSIFKSHKEIVIIGLPLACATIATTSLANLLAFANSNTGLDWLTFMTGSSPFTLAQLLVIFAFFTIGGIGYYVHHIRETVQRPLLDSDLSSESSSRI